MSDYRWRFVGAVAGLVTVIAVGLATLAFTMHDVRVVTRTVAANPGPPQGTISSAQLATLFSAGQQLDGLVCDYWTKDKLTLVCQPK